MSVLEMQPQSRPTMSWTEVCAADHRLPATSATVRRAEAMPRPTTRTLDRPRPAPGRSVAPGRRVSAHSGSVGQVRACRVQTPPTSPVVDDVPTWALLACGIVFGVLMLAALALLGGPAYA